MLLSLTVHECQLIPILFISLFQKKKKHSALSDGQTFRIGMHNKQFITLIKLIQQTPTLFFFFQCLLENLLLKIPGLQFTVPCILFCFRDSSFSSKRQLVRFVFYLNKQILRKQLIGKDKRAFSYEIQPLFSNAFFPFGYYSSKAGTIKILLTVL